MSPNRADWDWRYTLQFASGRIAPSRPQRKHAVIRATDVALCNRRLYWRLPEDVRRWLGATPDEAAVLDELDACQSCLGAIARRDEEKASD